MPASKKVATGKAVTELLLEWRNGDKAALDRLLPLVYDELRRVARARLKTERGGHMLQTTALVHEAYLRLVDLDRMTVQSRTHFFALAARLMREVLVDAARKRLADKRGGGTPPGASAWSRKLPARSWESRRRSTASRTD